MLTSSVPAGTLKTRVPGLCAFTFETRAEYDAQEENNSSRFPRGALGAATGGENSKHPPNTPVTVPKPKFEDAKLELGLRERRTGIFQKLKRWVLWLLELPGWCCFCVKKWQSFSALFLLSLAGKQALPEDVLPTVSSGPRAPQAEPSCRILPFGTPVSTCSFTKNQSES